MQSVTNRELTLSLTVDDTAFKSIDVLPQKVPQCSNALRLCYKNCRMCGLSRGVGSNFGLVGQMLCK